MNSKSAPIDYFYLVKDVWWVTDVDFVETKFNIKVFSFLDTMTLHSLTTTLHSSQDPRTIKNQGLLIFIYFVHE